MFKDDLKADLDVFYNTNEFGKKCIYNGKEVGILFAKNGMELFEVDFEKISARADDFENIEDGESLEIEGKKYIVQNFTFEKDFQVVISIKEEK